MKPTHKKERRGMSLRQVQNHLRKNSKYRKAEYDGQWDIKGNISLAITELRLDMGLSQANLARKVGTKQPAIARLEGGGVSPTLTYLNRIAKACNKVLIVKFKDAKPLPTSNY